MGPEIYTKMLKTLSEKLRAKFPATTPGCSMVKIAHLNESGHFDSCGSLLWKYLKLWGMNFIAMVMYWSQQRSRQGQRNVTSQSQEVASCLLRFTRRG